MLYVLCYIQGRNEPTRDTFYGLPGGKKISGLSSLHLLGGGILKCLFFQSWDLNQLSSLLPHLQSSPLMLSVLFPGFI